MAEISDLPRGVVNIFTESGKSTSAQLVAHPVVLESGEGIPSPGSGSGTPSAGMSCKAGRSAFDVSVTNSEADREPGNAVKSQLGMPGRAVDDGLALLYLLGCSDIELLGVTTRISVTIKGTASGAPERR